MRLCNDLSANSVLLFYFCFSADDHYIIDFESPEANGRGFFVQYLEGSKSKDENYLYDRLKITLSHGVGDLRDIPLHFGHVVLGGQAFYLSTPSIPFWMRDEDDRAAYHSLYTEEKCSKTADHMGVHANRISADPARLAHTVLFVLPEGKAFSTDFRNSDAAPSVSDKKVEITMRMLELETDVGNKAEGDGELMVPQQFFPGHFNLRVLSQAAAESILKKKRKKSRGFAAAFAGMHFGGVAKEQKADDEEEEVDGMFP